MDKPLFDAENIIIEDGRVVIDIAGYEVSKKIKEQLTQLSWRPYSLINQEKI